MHEARARFGCAVVDDYIYVMGGIDGNKELTSVERCVVCFILGLNKLLKFQLKIFKNVFLGIIFILTSGLTCAQCLCLEIHSRLLFLIKEFIVWAVAMQFIF